MAMSSRHTHFIPFAARERQLFPGDSGQLGPRLGDRLPEDLLHLLLRSPDHLDLRHPGQFPAHHGGLQQRVAGPPLLADGEVVKSFTPAGGGESSTTRPPAAVPRTAPRLWRPAPPPPPPPRR